MALVLSVLGMANAMSRAGKWSRITIMVFLKLYAHSSGVQGAIILSVYYD
jgi:hypothetical protein